MIDLKSYTHKETWIKRGKNFSVEVVRWEMGKPEWLGSIAGNYVWNIYCYLFPKHPLFKKAEKDGIFECPVREFHGGCTYSRWNCSPEGEVNSKTYGCDYNHYMDEKYTFMKTPNEASQIFIDADELFKDLTLEE